MKICFVYTLIYLFSIPELCSYKVAVFFGIDDIVVIMLTVKIKSFAIDSSEMWTAMARTLQELDTGCHVEGMWTNGDLKLIPAPRNWSKNIPLCVDHKVFHQ